MPPGRGVKSWISFEDEVTYGTEVGTSKEYLRIRDESMKLDVVPTEFPGMSEQVVQIYNSRDVVGGTISPELHYVGWGRLLRHIMGGYVYQVDTPVAGANTHTFTMADALPTGFTLEDCKGDIPTNDVFAYKGCKVNQAAFAMEQDDLLRCVMTLIGQSETPDVARFGAPSYPSYVPILWHNTGRVTQPTIAGSALDLKGFSLTINNNLTDDRFLLGKQIKEPIRKGRRVVEGSVTAEFENLTHYNKYKDGTTGTLTIPIESEQIITGATIYSMTINATGCHLTGETPVVADDGPMDQTLNFKLFASASELTITIVNDDTSYA